MATDFHSLWIGKKLGETELLTLYSFAEKEQPVNLWVYGDIRNIPEGTVLKDANNIIPESKVFKYADKGKIDWGKGSYAGFSDVFRYKLLHEKGGWWVDMDVTCLKTFDVQEEYFFRNHWLFPVVGNVMKCPQGSKLMLHCYERAVDEVNSENKEWHKPIKILNEEIEKLNLMRYRRLGLFNLDMQHTIEPYLKKDYPFPADWLGVHWINSAKINYKRGSAFYSLLKKYRIRWF